MDVLEEMVLDAAEPVIRSDAYQRKHHELVLPRGRVLSVMSIGAPQHASTNDDRGVQVLKVPKSRA